MSFIIIIIIIIIIHMSFIIIIIILLMSFIIIVIIILLLVSSLIIIIIIILLPMSFIIILIIILLLVSFSHQFELVVFHWSLSDCKSPLIYMTLQSILVDLKSNEVSILVLISSFSILCSRPSKSIPWAPTAVDITIVFIFHWYFSVL